MCCDLVLTEGFKQALLMDGNIQNLIPIIAALNYYEAYAFLDNMVSGDSITFTIYVYDPQDAVQKIYDIFTRRGVQTKPARFIPNLPTEEFKVTAEQTATGAGGFKTINAVRYDN